MYATNLIRVLCNHGSTLTRPLLNSRQCLKSNSFVVQIVNNTCCFESNLLSKSLTRILFSTNSSPDDNHNVSKGKSSTKRRRIISSSSSDENEISSSCKIENIKWVCNYFVLNFEIVFNFFYVIHIF